MTDDGVMMKKMMLHRIVRRDRRNLLVYVYTHTYYWTVWILVIHHSHDIIDVVISFGIWRFNFCCPVWEKTFQAMEHQLEQQHAPEDQEAGNNCGKLPLANHVGNGLLPVHFWWKALPDLVFFKCCYVCGWVTQMMQEDLEFGRLKHDEIWWNYLLP